MENNQNQISDSLGMFRVEWSIIKVHGPSCNLNIFKFVTCNRYFLTVLFIIPVKKNIQYIVPVLEFNVLSMNIVMFKGLIYNLLSLFDI